ncbi:MAG TPA: adenylate/guanylate cyclase domain-containing protein [Blastocatellia bacterium]|nr:adenylate/guanylate cyclase domain-containing protein [Blastocatellia bacterium]
MPRISYVIETRTAAVEPGETILQASLRAAIPHAHACGGQARCSTCRVQIVEGLDHCPPRNERESALATRLHFAPEIRLACQTAVIGDVKLRRLVLDAEDIKLTAQSGTTGAAASIGEEKKLAILFADIRGFTPFAEHLLPYDVVHVLNRYYYEVGRAISDNGGRIDNYMGDGLLALFGIDDSKDAAQQAVRAGLGMIAAVEHLKPYVEKIHGRSFEIGIGIHYGEVVVGAIGAPDMKRVTVIGDAVNLASRIESATKRCGARLLISEATFDELREVIQPGNSHRVELAGKSGEYLLYEIGGLIEPTS